MVILDGARTIFLKAVASDASQMQDTVASPRDFRRAPSERWRDC